MCVCVCVTFLGAVYLSLVAACGLIAGNETISRLTESREVEADRGRVRLQERKVRNGKVWYSVRYVRSEAPPTKMLICSHSTQGTQTHADAHTSNYTYA